MSLTNFRSILIFASCVVGTRNILQWGLRFKIAVCQTDENYLKHVALLNRFKICFILKRDFGFK